jgi:hypothetical protein
MYTAYVHNPSDYEPKGFSFPDIVTACRFCIPLIRRNVIVTIAVDSSPNECLYDSTLYPLIKEARRALQIMRDKSIYMH